MSVGVPGPVTTISYTQTISTASTFTIIKTAVTVPQVSFVTATATAAAWTGGPAGATQTYAAAATSVGLVPAAPPPTGGIVAATGSAATQTGGIVAATGSVAGASYYSGTMSATGTLPVGVQPQAAGESFATFTGAAVRNAERDFSMAVGGVLGLIALFA